jgi:hypothetical protein
MKLYRVTIEHTFFMVADGDLDHLDAEYAAREAVREDVEIDLITDTECTKLEEIPTMYRDSYPYGEGGNVRTCAQWLEHKD